MAASSQSPARDAPSDQLQLAATPKTTTPNCTHHTPLAGRLSMDELLSPRSPLLPWDRFTRWVYCVAVVTFDIELGQAIEQIYPANIKLTEREKSNICYLAFPDSNSGCMGDTQFHFRTRLCPIRKKSMPLFKDYNKDCLVCLQVDPTHFYGYVYFRQVKDRSARRGYFQKSLVLITRLPFIRLFNQLVQMMAPQFFECGEASLEAACHDIDQWPPPTPGQSLNLPLMGIVLQVHIPHKNDKPSDRSPQAEQPPMAAPSSTTDCESTVITTSNGGAGGSWPSNLTALDPTPALSLPSIYEMNLFRAFNSVISHVQLLWELVLTNEPITVMAPTPDLCSQLVQSLVSLISPLKYGSDFRPFFTIHDSEFKEYTTRTQSPPPIILGVTNPFFSKTLQHWPHIIRISDYGNTQKAKVKKSGQLKTFDWKPGVYTRYKPFLQKDRDILKKLLKGLEGKRPSEVQSLLLRRFLTELTQSFVIPLERYLASLMPLQKNVSPFKGTPILNPFNPEEFIKTLETSGPQLTCRVKGDWSGLYRRFFRTPNFVAWYDLRLKEANQKLRLLHIEAISTADLPGWVRDKPEVQVVDLVLRIKDKLADIENECLPVPAEVTDKLKNNLKEIINQMPEDLQSILRKY